MKKVLAVFLMTLCAFGIVNAQSPISEYVEEFRGDTAVIKGDVVNALYGAIVGDTVEVPAGRVYLLRGNFQYPLGSNPTTKAGRHTVIAGEVDTRIVNNSDASNLLPIICGSGGNSGGINYGGDLTVKNCSVIPASATGTLGWAFFGAASPGNRVTFENCLFERTRWVIINSNSYEGTRLYIKDCYFVNLSGQGCRRNGGVYDNVDKNTDTIWVENTTHIMAQGMQYKFRNYPIKKLVFNHNTFVNISGNVFETCGYQSNMIVTNNIFVNSNVQPYMPGLDIGETDMDSLPTGIINVRDLPSGFDQVERKILVDRNLVYWDLRLNHVVDTLKANRVNLTDQWYSQMIKMNTRTKAMFDNDTQYPFLVEGQWFEKCPNFTNAQDLLTDQVEVLRTFSMHTVDTLSGDIMPDWRKVFIGQDYYVYSDWPIPVDLSYDDADLMVAGLNKFPLGDLNWFPQKKADWLSQRSAEYTKLEDALNSGQIPNAVSRPDQMPTSFNVEQNYPNPFNPTTMIDFTIPNAGNVVVKIYNVLGQEVATLMNEFKPAGPASVRFDASNLPSGTYIYTVKVGNSTIAKKMMLLK